MEKNNVGKKFFNVASFQMLTEKAKQEPDDLEIIQDAIDDFTSYVKDVDVGEQQIKTAYATLDGEDLRRRVEAVDSRRRRCHEKAILSVKLMNRLAEIYNVSAVFTGHLDDRLEVADFCLDVTVTLFEDRTK